MSKISMGDTRREAINWVQDHLGPKTPRPLAETILDDMIRKGQVKRENYVFMIEADAADDSHLKKQAHNTFNSVFNGKQGSFRRSRTIMKWGALMKKINPTVFAPTVVPESLLPKKDGGTEDI